MYTPEQATEMKDYIRRFTKIGQLKTAADYLRLYAEAAPSDPDITTLYELISVEVDKRNRPIPDEVELLKSIETIFIMSTLNATRNGIMNSVLRKVKLMEDRWNYKPLLVFSDHNLDLRRLNLILKNADYSDSQIKLNKGTRIVSVYDYFQKAYDRTVEKIVKYTRDESDGTRYIPIAKNIYDVFKGDELVRREFFNGLGDRLRLIERFEEGVKVRGVYYDDWGYINKIHEYNPENDKHHPVINYYTTDLKLCIKGLFSFDEKKKENKLTKLIVYNSDGYVVKECADNAELTAFYFEQTIKNDGLFYMLVSENGLLTKAVTLSALKNISKVQVVHSTFLENSYKLSSKPQFYYKCLCENYMRLDGIIFLTNTEKTDFNKKYNYRKNTFAISHPYPYEVEKADFDKRDHKRAVIVSRLDWVKRINIAIDIFAEVINALPDIKLEIYGTGPEYKNLQEQIKKLNMESNILLKGFTNDPASIFNTSAVSVMTSLSEGFPLTLPESICNGCPVISFDLKYGPADVIDDGRTGYLIPNNNKEAFIEKLITFFSNEDLQRTMSENAYADAYKFGVDSFMTSWYELTKTLYNRR